jgi:U3 small nucleolar RNA-associated protein MPP10
MVSGKDPISKKGW